MTQKFNIRPALGDTKNALEKGGAELFYSPAEFSKEFVTECKMNAVKGQTRRKHLIDKQKQTCAARKESGWVYPKRVRQPIPTAESNAKRSAKMKQYHANKSATDKKTTSQRISNALKGNKNALGHTKTEQCKAVISFMVIKALQLIKEAKIAAKNAALMAYYAYKQPIRNPDWDIAEQERAKNKRLLGFDYLMRCRV